MVVIVISILFHAMGGENETSDEWRYNGDMYAKAASCQNDWGWKIRQIKDHYDASEDTYHQAMSRFKCIGCAKAYSKAKELSNHRRNCKDVDAQRSLILKNLQEKIARASDAQRQAEQSEPGMDEEEMMEGFLDEFPADTMEVEVRYQYLVSWATLLII